MCTVSTSVELQNETYNFKYSPFYCCSYVCVFFGNFTQKRTCTPYVFFSFCKVNIFKKLPKHTYYVPRENKMDNKFLRNLRQVKKKSLKISKNSKFPFNFKLIQHRFKFNFRFIRSQTKSEPKSWNRRIQILDIDCHINNFVKLIHFVKYTILRKWWENSIFLLFGSRFKHKYLLNCWKKV